MAEYKICTHCGLTKALKAFHKSAKGALGRVSECKPCRKIYNAARYTKQRRHILGTCASYRKANQEQRKDTCERWAIANRDRILELQRHKRKRQKQREKENVYHKEYRHTHPLQQRAWAIVQRAIKEGLLIRNGCVVCGEIETHFHHDNYKRPLQVVEYCQGHHAELTAMGEV